MSSETLSQQLLDCSAITVYFAVFDWNGFYASIFGMVLQSAVMAYKYHMVCKSLTADPPRKLTFPKQFDVTQLVMFVALAAIMIPERYTKSVAVWNNFIWSACFGVVAVIGYICDYPFIEQYARDEMPDEVSDSVSAYTRFRFNCLVFRLGMGGTSNTAAHERAGADMGGCDGVDECQLWYQPCIGHYRINHTGGSYRKLGNSLCSDVCRRIDSLVAREESKCRG
jgi:hypothetical protein